MAHFSNFYNITNEEEYMDKEKEEQQNAEDFKTLLANKDKIREIKEYHQAYIDVLEIFCNNPSNPTDDLNSHYTFLKKQVQQLLNKLGLYTTVDIYVPFKDDLYSAEKEWKQDTVFKGAINWDKIRPGLHAVHSWITQRCNAVESHGQQSDDEKRLLDINETIQKYRIQKTQKPKEVTRVEVTYKNEKESKALFYVTKDNDDIYYKGRYVNLSKKTDYYKVFCALYAKLPEGGEISYKDLIVEIKKRIPRIKDKNDTEMQSFIQRNITDKHNGFLRYAGIPGTEDNGKPLIDIIRSYGVTFNNRVG